MFRLVLIMSCICFQSFLSSSNILIGIAGGTGSGKTTLANKIQEALPEHSILICQDDYYKDISHLPLHEREKTNFDHPHSLDFARLQQNLIDLKNNQSIEQNIYSFHTHSPIGTKTINPAQVVIIEGILLFAIPEVRDLFDLKIFVDTDDDIRLLRRMERDIHERSRTFENVKEQYLKTVKPMHDIFVAPSKQYADIIVPKGGENKVALSMILSRLNEELDLAKKEEMQN